MSNYGQLSELALLHVSVKQPTPLVSQIAALVAVGDPRSRWAQHAEVLALVSLTEERAVAQISEVALLVAYVEGPRETFNSRAWGFTFDGHPFYVLHLGNTGTWVYDVSTEQWAQWGTEGVVTWNMEYGTEWDGETVAGDQATNDVWRLEPDSFLDDDFRPVVRRATAGYPVTGRDAVSMGIFTLEMAVQSTLEYDAEVSLSISDDKGVTFVNVGTLAVAADGDLSWRSLGSAKQPGRVFLIEDTGALVRIDGADVTVNQPKTKPKSG